MKQKVSSIQTSSNPTGSYGSFDARNTSTCDTEVPDFLTESFFKELGHLPTLLQNKMRNTPQCTECQQLTSDTIDCLNQLHSYLICEDCDKLFCGGGGYEESIVQNSSTAMYISLRLSYSENKNMDKKIHIVKNKIETVNNKIQHLIGGLVRLGISLQRLSQECSSLQNNCQEQNMSISKLKLNQHTTEQNLLEIKNKIEDLHYASYDGSLMWIINEFGKTFREAESGQKTSIYSPIFYSSASGYNMRARLDLYGDGDARGTHVSIFLVILKGEYDAILPWPFNFPVIFCLSDQSGQGGHIIDSFYPDTTSKSFQKPCSKENIASGILKFCPLAIMKPQGNRYIQNDKIYVKIMVDFLGIPRPILPYVLGLHPGLPTHEQEVQSRMEMEKYDNVRAALVAEINRNDQEMAQRSLIHTYPPVPLGNRSQPPPSTTNLGSMQCEDISDNE